MRVEGTMGNLRWCFRATTWLVTMIVATTLPLAFAQDPSTTTPPAGEVAPTTAPALSAIEAAQLDVQRLTTILNDESATQKDRDDAAKRLISRQNPQTREALRLALANAGPGGQLAAARALASDPKPNPDVIEPLFNLLANSTNRAIADAAAGALTTFQGNADVVERLATLASAANGREATRSVAIKALGALSEQRGADALVSIVIDAKAPALLRNNAAEALIQMSGQTDNARDAARWQQWWEQQRAKSPLDFKVDLLNARAARLVQAEAHRDELITEITTLLKEQYRATPETQKAERLLRLLKADQPEIRVVGAQIVYDAQVGAQTIPPGARERLRELVGDSDPRVRGQVALALGAINDAGALDSLLGQLAQESDPDVRASIMRALAPMSAASKDLRAIPEMIRMLRDPSGDTAQAAAGAIKTLAELLRESDPTQAHRVALQLRDEIGIRTGPLGSGGTPGTTTLRESLVEAMVPLRDPELLDEFRALLTPRESLRVRRFALMGLGALGDPRTTDIILNSIESDVEASVRLQAVTELGNTAGFEVAESLYRRLDPQVEADPSVRDKSWTVLESLFPQATKQQLTTWADRFKNEPARRLGVLKALRDQLVKDRAESDLAIVQQQIGETHMKLNEPGEAVQYFRLALEYWRRQHAETVVAEGLMGQLMDSLLLSRQYDAAAHFAEESITLNQANMQTMGSKFRIEAERLNNANELEAALRLTTEALKMKPPLAPRYLDELKRIEQDVRSKLPATTTTQPQPAAGQ